jgi:uncharacterized protein YfaS (alpha-2-macroglobulin family)
VAVVFLATVAASSQTPALRVVSAGPTGDLGQLADADDVRIVFSEPMIDLGVVPTGAAPSWMRLTPAVPGTFYWSGTRTLMFSPDANTPIPNATMFTVRVEGSATSVTGRTLGAPFEFKFTTPTVRLLSVDYYRKDGRFDQPAMLRLRFNQRVRPEDVLAHTRVALTPHDWTAPVMSEAARAWLQRTDPGGLARFDQKVAAVRLVTQSTTAVPVRVATAWDQQRFWPVPNQIVLETTTAPPTDGWLNVSIDADMPSPDGPARHATQSSVVHLEPTLFGAPMRCTRACDPLISSGDAGFTQPITTGALRRALSITDVTDAAMERPIAPTRAVPAERDKQPSWWGGIRGYEVGFDPQPPARTWRYRVDADLQSIDGQTLGYPRVEIVEHIHAQPYVGIGGSVWEPTGGSAIPIDARNVTAATVWSAPVSAMEIMPLLLRMQRVDARIQAPLPPTAGERRTWSAVTPDVTESRGEELRGLLSPQATGLAWVGVAPGAVLPGSAATDPNGNTARSNLVQVTNLGISVKDSSQSTLIFVTRLDNGAPVAEARVTLIDRANAVRWRGATDRNGVALAPAIALRDPSRPYDLAFIATAEKDGDLGFVSSSWTGPSSRNWSVQLRDGRPILRGSVFTDRGVYKEKEEVHFKAILREDASEGLRAAPTGTQFDVRVFDARGREADRRTIAVNKWSSADWVWRVPADAALGGYNIQITRSGSTSNRNEPYVEGEFLVAAYRQPNFRVDATLTADVPVLGTTLRGSIEAKYLFGAALGARPVRWWSRRQVVQAPPEAVRQRYPESRYAIGYIPAPGSRPEDPALPARTESLAADGRLTVSLPTTAEGDTAYSYSLEGDVEDVAGQHIANRTSIVVHPAALYVAFTRPSTFVETRTGLKLGILTSDFSGGPVRDVPVTVSLFREQWIYGEQSTTGFYGWKREEIPAGEWVVTSAAAETPLTIPLKDGGCYVVRATARDATGRRTRTDATFYAVGPGVSSWRSEGTRIDLTPERQTWKPGENARILIQSPWERATALVTVEREGIRHHHTFTVTSTQDTVTVPVTAADVPNVFVSVLLVKGRTSNELAADGRDAGQPSYRLGYTELTVDDALKRLTVDVTADKREYRPRQPATVSVSVRTPDGAAAASEVTLWAVDYGVLSLTAYSVPDVVKALYPNQPLQVTNEDSRVAMMSRRRLVDRPVPPPPPAAMAAPEPLAAFAFSRNSTITGLPQQMLNMSLDGVATLNESVMVRGASPIMFLQGVSVDDIRTDFRSLVFWAGSVTTDATGRATTTVTLPDSLTSYRIVAVAGDDRSRFGVGEREIRVTKPLTLLPEFPRFLSAGDRASFGAVVTNSGAEAGEATVEIQSLDPETLQFGTTSRRSIRLAPGASESLRFDAIAGVSGSARVRLAVRMGSEVDAFEMPLLVTSPMRLETTAAYGDTVGTALERLSLPPGISRTAGGLDVELASTALVGLGESARYLTEYPFECAEQKASRSLALLLSSELGGAFKLSGVEPDQYRAEGERDLRALYGYQCGNGGFSLWPGSCGTESAYLTAYVLHVLKVGDRLKIPADAEATRRALDYLQQQLSAPPPELNWRPVWGAAQAYSLKVLAEYGRQRPNDVTRLVNDADRLPVFALSNLADALSGMQADVWRSRYDDVVRRLTNALRIEADRTHVEEVDEAALSWLWNTNVRATAVVLDGFARRLDDATLVPGLVRWLVASRTNGRWGTTHENAMALEALVAYYRAFENEVPAMTTTVKVGAASIGTATFNGRSTTAQQVRLSMDDLLKQLSSNSSPTLTIARDGTGRAYYTARIRYLAPEPPTPVDRGFHVERKYEPFVPDGTRAASTSFAKGDLVRVTVALTLRGEGRYLALTDPLPAGFEPLEGWFQTTASDLARQATVINRGGDWFSAWRRGTFDHVEKHDDRVVGFATRLGSGRHEFTYLVRATTAGTFTAAGARVEAMYAPELTGKSAASTVTVK